MNILYLGPYKHKNALYHASLDIIRDLLQNSNIDNLHIRPIYANGNFTKDNKDFIIQNLSGKSLLNHYDVIIQHCPITMISNTFDLCDTSVAIPLFSKIIGSNRYQKKLEGIDLFLTDSPDHTDFLNSYYNLDSKTFSYSQVYASQSNISFPIYEETIKIYSTYETYNANIFEKTIIAFYEACVAYDNISLIFVISNADQSVMNQLNTDFEKVKTKLGLKSNIFNVQVMIKDFSFEELCAIHKKCDVYIDLEQSNFSSKINRYIAKQMNSTIITDHDVTNDITPIESTRGVFHPNIGTSNLITLIQKCLSNKHTSSFGTYPNIGSFICQ